MFRENMPGNKINSLGNDLETIYLFRTFFDLMGIRILQYVLKGLTGIFVDILSRLYVLEPIFDIPLNRTDLHTCVLGYLKPVIIHS